ncbi:MAG: ubiquinol-cytochrome c reductase iron-sulfur subunit [Pseudomonas sp.]
MSDKNQVDRAKRRFLITATALAGGTAAGASAVPFVCSMLPSQRALAIGAPVEVDIGKMEAGAKLDIEWQGKVVWIVNRTQDMLEVLPKLNDKLADPDSESSLQPGYCKNPVRSRKSQYLVAVGLCTHLGCSPTYRKEVGAADLGADWPGGFFCPCHGSRFDLAGRVFKNVPAPTNLTIPPYKYLSDTKILIGDDGA